MIIDYSSVMAIVFFVLLAWVAFFLYRTLKKEQEFQDKQKQTLTHYQHILKHGSDEARRIVDKTTEESAQILADARETNEHMVENLDHVLQDVAKEHIHEMKSETEAFETNYQEKLQTVEQHFNKNADEVIATTQKGAEEELGRFTKSLIEKTASAEHAIDAKTQELLQQVEVEIDTYKRQRMSKLDEEITQLIQKTYTDVMHRTMPEAVHHELIMESLEKAKKDGVFTP